MLKKLTFSAFLLFIFFANTNFAQETFTQSDAQVSVTLPAGWQYETQDKMMIASPSEGGFFVYFKVLHVDALDAALGEADEILAGQFKDIKLGDARNEVVNGMNAISVSGTADGAQLFIGVLDTPAANISLLVWAMGTDDIITKYSNDIATILTSIQPAQ